MNKREKELVELLYGEEEAVLKDLEKQYKKTLDEINLKIRILQSDELTQSKVYQLQYQQALKKQIEGLIEKLHGDEYSTIQQYLHDSYTNGFVGTMYNITGQGIPMILPIDQNAAVKAILTDSKLNDGLYDALGVDTNRLKKTIRQEITRGIAGGMSYNDIARNITNATRTPLSNAKRIAVTEGHRIQQAATYDAQKASKSKGADVVKQWDSTLDGNTRPTHRKLDGQIREVDKPFEEDGKEAMFPGDFGDPAEDCNCRCVSLTRARWALDEDELQTLKDRAEYFGLDKSKEIDDFKKKYLNVNDEWASADAKTKEHLNLDARDSLDEIVARSTTKIKQGISAFPDDDVLKERTKLVDPDGNKFDVAMHGTPNAVAFGGRKANMSPRLLASIIRHSEGYHGQDIRLLSCSTGVKVGEDYCFAEELANALGVKVFAPNDLIFFRKNGTFYIGEDHSGSMIEYKPNERRRLS